MLLNILIYPFCIGVTGGNPLKWRILRYPPRLSGHLIYACYLPNRTHFSKSCVRPSRDKIVLPSQTTEVFNRVDFPLRTQSINGTEPQTDSSFKSILRIGCGDTPPDATRLNTKKETRKNHKTPARINSFTTVASMCRVFVR